MVIPLQARGYIPCPLMGILWLLMRPVSVPKHPACDYSGLSYICLRTFFRILPLGFLGRASVKMIFFGTL